MPWSASISSALRASSLEQLLDLRLLRERDPPQLLDVLLALEIDHDVTIDHITRRSETSIFSLERDRRQRQSRDRRASQPSMNSASSLCVSRTTWPSSRHSLREAAVLEPLLEDAQPGAVPDAAPCTACATR